MTIEDNFDHLEIPELSALIEDENKCKTFVIDEKYVSVTKYRRSVPILHWDPLSPIEYLTPITADKHFQAHCTDFRGKKVTGRFYFEPQVGTVFSAGIQTLSLTFIPNNEAKYRAFKTTKEIEVKKRKPQVTWDYVEAERNYLHPLPEDIFTCVECELKQGNFEFSHQAGVTLSVGKHKLIAEYHPSKEESVNYTRGYASITLTVITTRVPLQWELVTGREGELVYPAPLPSWLFTARCLLSEAEGHFEYTPHEGAVLNAGEHELTGTFIPRDRNKFYPTPIIQRISIAPCPVKVVWSQPVPLPSGDPLGPYTLAAQNARGLEGEYRYDPPLGTVLTEGVHTLRVHFTPFNTNYRKAEEQVKLRVYPPRKLKLQWFPPESIVYPTILSKLQLNASLVGFGRHTPGEFFYTPTFGAVLEAGEHTLQVTFRPDRLSFLPVSAEVSLTVARCQVKLLWHPPDPILEGEGLFDSVLNCRVSYPPDVEGEFFYTPPLGTPLQAGTHLLKVEFVPKDGANYLGAREKVMLIVRERTKYKALLQWMREEKKEGERKGEGEGGGGGKKGELEALLSSLSAPSAPALSLAAAAVQRKMESRLAMGREGEEGGGGEEERREVVYGEIFSPSLFPAYCSNAQGGFTYNLEEGFIPPVGEHRVVASFSPDPTRSPLALPSSLSLLLTVTPRTPFLDWKLARGGELDFGESLEREYATAVALFGERDRRPVAGEFFYTPPRGAVPEAGAHLLEVVFHPHDKLNFRSIRETREVFVKRVFPSLLWDPPSRPLSYPHAVLSMEREVGGGKEKGKEKGREKGEEGEKEGEEGDGEEGGEEGETGAGTGVGAGGEGKEKGERKTEKSLLAFPRALGRNGEELEGQWEFNFPLSVSLPAGEHTLTCQFYPKDIINYYGARGSISFTVLPCLPSLVWSPEEVLVYEEPLSLSKHCNAVSPLPGSFTYSPSPFSILPASSLTLLSLSFQPEDALNYLPVSLVRRLEVKKREASLSWALPRRLPYGTVVRESLLNASLSPDENSPVTLSALSSALFSYSPPLGEVVQAGERVKFTVSLLPPEEVRGNYAVVQKVVEVEVYPTSPTLSWRPVYLYLSEGEALSPLLYLNAFVGLKLKSRVETEKMYPGTLSYSPPEGTVLPPGRHQVTVSFTPLEPRNALPTSLSLSFTVNRKAPQIVWELDPLTGKMKSKKVAK